MWRERVLATHANATSAPAAVVHVACAHRTATQRVSLSLLARDMAGASPSALFKPRSDAVQYEVCACARGTTHTSLPFPGLDSPGHVCLPAVHTALLDSCHMLQQRRSSAPPPPEPTTNSFSTGPQPRKP